MCVMRIYITFYTRSYNESYHRGNNYDNILHNAVLIKKYVKLYQDAIDYYFQSKVKEALGKVCTKLPESIENQCTQFVDLYGDAIVAILVQEIDPSQVSVEVHPVLII